MFLDEEIMNLKNCIFVCLLMASFQQTHPFHFSEQEKEELKNTFEEKARDQREFCSGYNESNKNSIIYEKCKKTALFYNQTPEEFLNDLQAQGMAVKVAQQLMELQEYKAYITNHEKKDLHALQKAAAIFMVEQSKVVENSQNLPDQEKHRIVLNFFIYVEFIIPRILTEDMQRKDHLVQ